MNFFLPATLKFDPWSWATNST